MLRQLFFFIFLIIGIGGCSSLPRPEGFSYQEIKTKNFSLASWARVKQKGRLIRIYIEGDGFAWVNPYTPSADPTPSETTGLNLAQKDPFANVIYLGRPCQYVSSRECRPYYWTNGRFDPKVITSVEEAVRKLMKQYQAPSAELVGYSGGAAVALLVAIRMPTVSKVMTVAGVLDHKAWTSFHKDSPLKGSLNPADYKQKLARIKQVHYSGGADKTVPSSLTENFVYSLGSNSQAEIIIVPNASHNKGWVNIWPRLVN